ncbi:MAG TPA: MBL fold metallo-hydrolase [Opitutaceae bacterium]
MNRWPAGLHALGTPLVRCHLLVEGNSAVLIDTGLWGIARAVRHRMQRLGLGPENLRAILLTHGHLDHTAGLAALKSWSGAPVYAHPREEPHIDGVYPYTGSARFCGWLEAAGRRVFRYRPVKIDRPLADGDVLPFWGGLRVLHLPGHTAGHCGFFSERHRLFFCGDLFASYAPKPRFPPDVLNVDSREVRHSAELALLTLGPVDIVPNHYDVREPHLHGKRFRQLLAEERQHVI